MAPPGIPPPPPLPPPKHMPKAPKYGKKINPEKTCKTLSASAPTLDYINEHWGSFKKDDQKKARKVVKGLKKVCEATDGCTFQEHNAKCKPIEEVKRKKRASSKRMSATKKPAAKRASSKKKTPVKRSRSASPARKATGMVYSLPALRKKGIDKLTKDELVEFVKRTRVAVAKKQGKKVSDVAALPAGLSAKSKADLVKLAKQWNNKL